FVATGFNQLVNNAAKLRYRWGALAREGGIGVPMVLRMPWGGLRHAGPYHSQNTEAWFYRVPGLKIVAPSPPHDARPLMAPAVALLTVAPLDRDAILSLARHCNRVLVVHEDTRTGSIGESIAAIIQEEAFEYLDAPVRVVGALDTPVPYSPPLEEEFLPSEADVERAARLLLAGRSE